MKQVTVKTPFFDRVEYTMLASMEDVKEYSDIMVRGVEKGSDLWMSSKVKTDRWDHVIERGPAQGIMSMAFSSASMKGTNPLFEIPFLVTGKIQSIENLINRGEKVLINSVGGYCYLMDDMEIIEETKFVLTKPNTVDIKKNTKYINLENDAELEQHTIDYLTPIDPNFSSVCRLRDFNKEELVEIFEKFLENGGEMVYVYTTGIDERQMWEYTSAIIDSGIMRVEFEFNCGVSDEHEKIIKKLRDNGLFVTFFAPYKE